MPFSFHAHSGQFCEHAQDTLAQVVERAAALGLRAYGLSEHQPRFHDAHLYPEERERGLGVVDLRAAFDRYLVEARRLQRDYATRMHVLVGVETEHLDRLGLHSDAAYDAWMKEVRGRVDFVVGSVHHVHGVPIDFSRELYDKAVQSVVSSAAQRVLNGAASGATGDTIIRETHQDVGSAQQQQHESSWDALESLHLAYYDALLDVLVRHRPNIVGHFDLIRLHAPIDFRLTPRIWTAIERCVDVILEQAVLVELNSRGWKKFSDGSAYPSLEVMRYMHGRGVCFTLGDDAHAVADVAMYYERVVEYLRQVGIDSLYYLEREGDGASAKVVMKELRNVAMDPFWMELVERRQMVASAVTGNAPNA